MTQTTASKPDHAATLLAIHLMRMNPAYRDAEVMRRKKGLKAMIAKKDSAEYAAILLLVGTWNAIGSAVRLAISARAGGGSGNGGGGVGDAYMDSYLNAIFETVPVCHMYTALQEALKKIEQDWGEEFAPDFNWLYEEYLKWLKKQGKSEKYRTAHCNGIRALFG